MSDPMKDAQIRRDKKKRKATYEEYEPIVLWVKPGRFMVDATGNGTYPTEKIIKSIIKDNVGFEQFITISDNEPNVKEVVTEFDND